jgi:hypothetical protein
MSSSLLNKITVAVAASVIIVSGGVEELINGR